MKKILYALLAFTLGAACCACNDDDDPVVIASELEITPPQLDFEWNQTDSQLVTVNTNGLILDGRACCRLDYRHPGRREFHGKRGGESRHRGPSIDRYSEGRRA